MTIACEKEGDGRWMIRLDGLRIGIVTGGNRRYVAENRSGKFIGVSRSVKSAAKLLVPTTEPQPNGV